MSEHAPVDEEVLPLDCYYGECEHADPDDCVTVVQVCAACRVVAELEELECFVRWPCEHAPEPEPVATIAMPLRVGRKPHDSGRAER